MNFTHGIPEEPKKRKRGGITRNQIILAAVIAAVVIGAITSSLYFFAKYNNLKDKPVNKAQDVQERIPKKVARLYSAPNETPTIATVNDRSKLQKEQGEFFAKAKNGDFVIVYPRAQQAVIYRESIDKIINTGPIDTQPQNNTSATTPGTSVQQ